MDKQIKLFLEFLQNDKKLSNNTLQSYKRDIMQFRNYVNANNINYAKAKEEDIKNYLKELQEDVRTTKSLAEDVHILEINMENMQKTMDETKRTVDALNSKEFTEYKENKKLVKQNISSAVVGAIMGFGLSLVAWLIRFFIMNGGG